MHNFIHLFASLHNYFANHNHLKCLSKVPNNVTWTGFDDSKSAELPPSESGFFANASAIPASSDKAFGDYIVEPDEPKVSVNDNLNDEVFH